MEFGVSHKATKEMNKCCFHLAHNQYSKTIRDSKSKSTNKLQICNPGLSLSPLPSICMYPCQSLYMYIMTSQLVTPYILSNHVQNINACNSLYKSISERVSRKIRLVFYANLSATHLLFSADNV